MVSMATSACASLPSTRLWAASNKAMEAFIHNMNTIHSRGGNQVVFSSINYSTTLLPKAVV